VQPSVRLWINVYRYVGSTQLDLQITAKVIRRSTQPAVTPKNLPRPFGKIDFQA